MRDPVTGFDYPKAWQEKCRSAEDLADVKKRAFCPYILRNGTAPRVYDRDHCCCGM